MLSVNQLTFKVKNKTLIDELTLNVTPGSFYALLGRKGSGKTTLSSLFWSFRAAKRKYLH